MLAALTTPRPRAFHLQMIFFFIDTATKPSCAHNCKKKCKHKCCHRRKQAEKKLIEEEKKLKSKPTSHSATHPKAIAGCQLCLHSVFPKTVKHPLTAFQRSIADLYIEHVHQTMLDDPFSFSTLISVSKKLEKWQQMEVSDHEQFSKNWFADGMLYIDE